MARVSKNVDWKIVRWYARKPNTLIGCGTKTVVPTEVMVVVGGLAFFLIRGNAGLVVACLIAVYWVACRFFPVAWLRDDDPHSTAKTLNELHDAEPERYLAECIRLSGTAGEGVPRHAMTTLHDEITTAIRSLRSIGFDNKTVSSLRLILPRADSLDQELAEQVRQIAVTMSNSAKAIKSADRSAREPMLTMLTTYASQSAATLSQARQSGH